MCCHSHTHGRHRDTLKLNSLLLQPLQQHGALTNYRCSVLLQQKNELLVEVVLLSTYRYIHRHNKSNSGGGRWRGQTDSHVVNWLLSPPWAVKVGVGGGTDLDD